MRIGRVADRYLLDGGLTQLRADTTHLSLLLADPFTISDPLTVEPSGAFTRVRVSWGQPALLPGGVRRIANLNQLVWVGLPPSSLVICVAGFTAAFNGEFTFAAPVPPSYFPAGGGATLGVDKLYVRLL